MIHLARLITGGALRRNESRGAHYKPDYPDRDDANFQKTTISTYKGFKAGKTASAPFGDGQDHGTPQFSYEPIDVSLIKPRPRKYDVEKSS
jgi:succinate dehydrogenase / fumarate reductase flavoprotein subunit